MTDNILTIDCSPPVINVINDLLGKDAEVESHAFKDISELKDYRMIIIQDCDDQDDVLKRIKKIRYACYFKNIPIILIKIKDRTGTIESYVTAGATEVLSLGDPQAALRQILKGYLIPNRQPLTEEMDYIKSFAENTCNVIKTVASLDATFKEVYFSNDFKIFGDISGLLALSGGADGILGITFYWPLAQRIIARMMATDEEKINAELIHDGVAEIVNMIGGSTKKEFVGKPYHFEISVPTVIVGSGHQIGHAENAPVAVLIFKIDFEYFALKVCLKPNKENKEQKA